MFQSKIIIRNIDDIESEFLKLSDDLKLSGLTEQNKTFILTQAQINFVSIRNQLSLKNLSNIVSENIISADDYFVKIILDTRKPNIFRKFFKR